jgi:hypothetical protein
MASHIERRKFLATLGGAPAAWPLAARAQQPERPQEPVIGYLSTLSEARGCIYWPHSARVWVKGTGPFRSHWSLLKFGLVPFWLS